MPLQKRLPKYGFSSRIAINSAQVRLSELAKLASDEVTISALKEANIINANITRVKIFLSGDVNKAYVVKELAQDAGKKNKRKTKEGILVTKGAIQAIEAAGGTVG